MRAVIVALLFAAVLVSAADVDTEVDAEVDKPRAKRSAKPKLPVRVLENHHFMPKSRIVLVPKGDPRARPATSAVPAAPVFPSAFPSALPVAPTSSAAARPVLRGTVTTSAACAAQQGTCKASSTCTGSIVRGICPGDASITCCTPKASTATCPVYASAATQKIKGNGGVMYDVVRIASQHFVGGADNTMTKPTACAFARMAAAASSAGIRLAISSGFRTYERQVYFWNCYQTKKCNNGNRAARPGTSNHGRGQALDINTGATSTATYKWMAANAARFGFRRTVSDEPWHWEL